MATFKEGDRVRIVGREPTDEDVKSQMYYAHYSGLSGTVQKVYNKDEVAVEVDHESLTKEIRKRHDDVRNQMKTKWIEGLSDEGRGRLTEREKDFNLRYVVLVSMQDLDKGEGTRRAVAPKPAAAPSPVPSAAGEAPAAPTPRRKTLAELEAAEEEELRKRQGK